VSTTLSSAFVWLVVVANAAKPVPVYDAAALEESFQTLDGLTLKEPRDEKTYLEVEL
jgi:hypothetical protein